MKHNCIQKATHKVQASAFYWGGGGAVVGTRRIHDPYMNEESYYCTQKFLTNKSIEPNINACHLTILTFFVK